MKSTFIAWFFNEFKFDPLFVTMDGLAEDSPWHRESSIGIHTNMVVTEYLSRTSTDWTTSDVLGAFAAAFHDVGKPGAREVKWKEERGNYNSFNGHELLSARLWEDWAVRNWDLLTDRFGFTIEDLYRVAWMVEHHKPWDLKNPNKLNNLATTAKLGIGMTPFTNLLYADTWGRLSDDQDQKRTKVADWISELEIRADAVAVGVQQTDELRVVDRTEKQPNLIVPIGASGSGKSTAHNEYFANSEVYSWDELRTRWYHEDYDEAFRLSCEDKQFLNKANSEFSQLLKKGNDLYVDNTNTSAKRRRFFVDQARRAGYTTIAVLMPSTIQTVVERQDTRTDKTVPENAVELQYLNTQMPQLGEFDIIRVLDGNI